jgi:phosphatidylglycerol:prolipoprotein diacylglycerol transferase
MEACKSGQAPPRWYDFRVLGSWTLEAYPLIFALGVAASLVWLGWPNRGSRRGFTPSTPAPQASALLDAGLATLAGGMIGARAVFILLHLEHYAGQPWEILWYWQGGLNAVGGILGALLGIGIYALLTDTNIGYLGDELAIPATIVAFSCWTGCLVDGCAYGIQAPLGPLTTPLTDMFGNVTSRWPTQATGALLNVVALTTLAWMKGRKLQPGILLCTSLSLISATMFVLSFTRADPSLTIAGMRLDTLGSAALLALAVGAALLRIRRP